MAGENFHEFFANVASGQKGTSQVPYRPLLHIDPNSPFNQAIARHTGNFDEHIARSIPGYREVTSRIGDSLLNAYSGGGHVLDIGASDASFGKALADASRGRLKATSVDPNDQMHAFAQKRSQVQGHDYKLEAFGGEYNDDGRVYPQHNPSHRYDAIHEGMVFQFMGPEREQPVAEVKRLLHPHGVFITRQKFLTDNYEANEVKKDGYKSQYFPASEMTQKAKEVLEGMKEGQVHHKAYEETLRRNFKHVEPFWDAGNFKGYLASDSKPHLDRIKQGIGDTTSNFSETSVNKSVPVQKNENDLGRILAAARLLLRVSELRRGGEEGGSDNPIGQGPVKFLGADYKWRMGEQHHADQAQRFRTAREANEQQSSAYSKSSLKAVQAGQAAQASTEAVLAARKPQNAAQTHPGVSSHATSSTPDLGQVRGQIDHLDGQLIAMLGQRQKLALHAGQAKAQSGQPVQDLTRERELLESRGALAQKHGLDPVHVQGLFRHIMQGSRAAQIQAAGKKIS